MRASSSLFSESSAVWVLAQQVAVRALVAVKFFWVASLVGPEVIGYVSLGLLVLAIAEALLDTGLLQAAIQSDRVMSSADAGAWIGLQGIRGGVIAAILWGGAGLFADLMQSVSAVDYIQAVALIPIIKSASSPGVTLAHRGRKFRSLFLIEFLASLVDLIFCLVTISAGYGGVYVIFGALVGDFFRSACSWIFFPLWGRPHIQWRSIDWLTSYGRWVWQTSVLVAVLNQVDKLIVARMLGVHEVGIYQTASKLTQLLIVDMPGAYSQYLFPTFSALFRENPLKIRDFYLRALLQVALASAVGAAVIFFGLLNGIIGFLGKDWGEALPLMNWLVLPMFLGAVLSVMVALARAIGAPDAVARATRYQLITLCLAAPAGINYFGVRGLIIGLAVAGLVAAAAIHFRCQKVVRVSLL